MIVPLAAETAALPSADGVLIESSDYGVCRCDECGPRYYDHKFAFVRWLSNKLWEKNPSALVLVYPHYFTGKKVPGLDATAARQPFDPRWGLFFTPHSAHFDDDLIRRARSSVCWSDATALGTPSRVAEAARAAASRHASVGTVKTRNRQRDRIVINDYIARRQGAVGLSSTVIFEKRLGGVSAKRPTIQPECTFFGCP
jgi:hypothetical protein